MTVDVLYVAFNRLAFTRLSFQMLVENTDWSLVRRLVVYDDSSTDGTGDWLADQRDAWDIDGVDITLVTHRLRSPIAVMKSYLLDFDADAFAKIDNDIGVPPGWLNVLTGVLDRSPDLELLGMEAGRLGLPGDGFDGVYEWEPCSHIGGVGLMRRSAFTGREAMHVRGRFGFTEWQHEQEPVRGWVKPDVPVCCFDLIPEQPFKAWSKIYVQKKWQRHWAAYDPKWGHRYFDAALERARIPA